MASTIQAWLKEGDLEEFVEDFYAINIRSGEEVNFKMPMQIIGEIDTARKNSGESPLTQFDREDLLAHLSKARQNDPVARWFRENQLDEFEEDFRCIGVKKLRHLEHLRNGKIDWLKKINEKRKKDKGPLNATQVGRIKTAFRGDATAQPIVPHVTVAPPPEAAHIAASNRRKDGEDSEKNQDYPSRHTPAAAILPRVAPAACPLSIMEVECKLCLEDYPLESMVTVDECLHQVCKLCLKRHLLLPGSGLLTDKGNFRNVDFRKGGKSQVGFHPATRAMTVLCPYQGCCQPICRAEGFFRNLFSNPPFLSFTNSVNKIIDYTALEECKILNTAVCWAIEDQYEVVACPLGPYKSTGGFSLDRDLLQRKYPDLLELVNDGVDVQLLLPQEYYDAAKTLSRLRECNVKFDPRGAINRITCPPSCLGCGRDFCFVCNQEWTSCRCERSNIEVEEETKKGVLAVALPPRCTIPPIPEKETCAVEHCPVESKSVECASCGARCCDDCTSFEVYNKTPILDTLEDLDKIKENGINGAVYSQKKVNICFDCYEYYLHNAWHRLVSNDQRMKDLEARTGLSHEDLHKHLFQPCSTAIQNLKDKIRQKIEHSTDIRLEQENIVFEREKIQLEQDALKAKLDAFRQANDENNIQEAEKKLAQKDPEWQAAEDLFKLRLSSIRDQLNEELDVRQAVIRESENLCMNVEVFRRSMVDGVSKAVRSLYLPVCERLCPDQKRGCFLTKQRMNDLKAFVDETGIIHEQRFNQRRREMDDVLGRERNDARQNLQDLQAKLDAIKIEREAEAKRIRDAEENRIRENRKKEEEGDVFVAKLPKCPKCHEPYQKNGCNLVFCANCNRRFGKQTVFCHLCQTVINHGGGVDGHEDPHFKDGPCTIW